MAEFGSTLPFKLARNNKAPLCQASRCQKDRQPKSIYCYKHHARKWRHQNPFRCYWHWLKDSAAKRRIPFKLTYNQWVLFCLSHEERGIQLRGKCGTGKLGPTIDRIDAEKGYELGNIQIIAKYQNSKKWHEEDKPARESSNNPF